MSKSGKSVNNIISEKCSRHAYRLSLIAQDTTTARSFGTFNWPQATLDNAIRNAIDELTKAELTADNS